MSFAGKDWIASGELIEVRTNRPLLSPEGTLAVFLGYTDITTLFDPREKALRYSTPALPLPSSEHSLVVYVVSRINEWKELGKFPLRIKEAKDSGANTSGSTPTNEGRKNLIDTFEIKPSLTFNLKAESTVLFFPNTNRPDRLNFTDLTFQGSLQTNLSVEV